MIKFITILFLIHGFIGLERLIIVNELFSLFGALILISLLVSRRISIDKLNAVIVLFLAYGLVHIAFGFTLNDDASAYEKLRTLPIYYSILCFYLGYYVVAQGFERFLHSRYYSYIFSFLIFAGMILGPKIALPAMFSFGLSRLTSRRKFYFILCGLVAISIPAKLILVKDYHNDLTVLATLFFLIFSATHKNLLFIVIKNKKSPYVFFAIFLFFIVLLKIAAIYLDRFYYYGYDYFSLISDPNIIWRLMFWVKTIDNLDLHQWFFGIGLGTPIFDEFDPKTTFITFYNPGNNFLPYTLGLHNSFITFFVRFGLIGTVFLIYTIFTVLKGLAKNKSVDSEAFFITVILFAISALFNVMLESPLFAGTFWLILGMAYKKANIASKA